MMSQVIIGTAGHIDHGKTALVKALTGTDTDRLPEEQRRGMTIDLGFAFLTDHITIIDVPGHEKFIRNMVAGVSTVDIALLAIAADDGIMPQTREHLDILQLLKVQKGCVAITKCDLSESKEWLYLLEEDIKDYIGGTTLKEMPIVRTSAVTGEGITDLKKYLLNLSNQVQARSDRGFFRQSIDRVFTMKGFGTVVTGTVISGSATVGDSIEIVPGEVTAKIRSLQSHGKDVKMVQVGDRSAVNLSGVDRQSLKRGSQIVSDGFLKAVKSFGAHISLTLNTSRKLKHEQRVRVHIGTDEIMGRVYIVSSNRHKSIQGGEEATVLIRLEKPAPLAMDDPLIIRLYSPPETLGGGTVIDTYPPFRWKDTRKWLQVLDESSNDIRPALFFKQDKSAPKTLLQWCQRFQMGSDQLQAYLETLDLIHFGPERDPFIALADDIEEQKLALLDVVNTYHEQKVYRLGIPRDELRQKLGYSEALFDFLLSELVGKKELEIRDGLVRASGYVMTLSESDQVQVQKVFNKLQKYGTTPPVVIDLARELGLSEKKVQEILHVLKNEQRVTDISRNLWYSTKVLSELERTIRKYFTTHQTMSVLDFKSLTKTTRKHAIPLLEYLDRHEITLREGDRRVLA